MSADLHKFPKTPHLYWLGNQPARDDKVFSARESEALLDGELVVEEKVDGANLGLSMTTEAALRFQNRGNFLEGKLTGQFAALRGWAVRHREQLHLHLPPGTVLFGEWCRLRHSIHYTALPDWFLGFDLLETASGRFWSASRRNTLLATLGMAAVRPVAHGRLTRNDVLALLGGKSAYAETPMEGVYLRRENAGYLVQRAKIVRAEFTQAIGEHWAKGLQVENCLGRRLS